jgi:quercetin dioxygenase-like cupin family protein
MSCDEELDFSLLAQDTARFRRRVVELSPGEDLSVDSGSWRDAIAFVEEGEVELECVAGERRRFARGAVLCFPPPVRLLRNRGGEPARLIAISRRTREPSKSTG